MTTTQTTSCSECGRELMAVRVARGLRCFCQVNATGREPMGHATYSAAVAAHPGQRIRAYGGGSTGAPKRFAVG
jgi:hypothetical protein